MARASEHVTLTEGPQGLMIPKIELTPLEGMFGMQSPHYIFEDVYAGLDAVYRANSDPNSPSPLVVSADGMPPITLSRQLKEAGRDAYRNPEVIEFSVDAVSPGVSFNMLKLLRERRRLRIEPDEPWAGSVSRYASAAADPFGLTQGFDIRADHMHGFSYEYPINADIERFYMRSKAILQLLGISSPTVDEEKDPSDDFDFPDWHFRR